jgi:hypothetical protein
MRFGWSPQDSSARIRGVAKLAAILCIVIYIFVYLQEPFAGSWNDAILYLLLIVAAGLTASLATMLCLHYEREETPRRIWRYFAIGLWLWTAAELIYAYWDMTLETVPKGFQDVLWVAAYLFFAYALLIQYRLLANPSSGELSKRIAFAALFLLVLLFLVYQFLITWLGANSPLDAIVDAFYPVADFCLALIAIWLMRHFQGGAFARPWLGLLLFSFADLLYAGIDTLGLYQQADSGWPAMFDTSYIAAYLILGLGLLAQWAFLKYGLRSPASTR